jgi:CRP-like cAMP-binding protein
LKTFSAVAAQSAAIRSPLFEGIPAGAMETLFACLMPRRKRFEKNALVLREGEEPRFAGIVLSGGLHILRDDYWGNRTLVARVEPGDLFAEAFVCGGVKRLPVSVAAAEPSEALFLEVNRVMGICSSACAAHNALIKNMLAILARKNIGLMEKLECVTQRSTRSKILSYLSALARREKKPVITIPFNRQELADYLSVERSALSAELGRMRDEGLLDFHKNQFQLAEAPDKLKIERRKTRA